MQKPETTHQVGEKVTYTNPTTGQTTETTVTKTRTMKATGNTFYLLANGHGATTADLKKVGG